MDTTGRCRFGLFAFDFRTGELRREGEVVKLAPQPARVLALLLERPGELVLRDDLRRNVWGDGTFVDFERGLNFCVVQVRAALGDSSDNPRFVETVPRKGYRFIAPVLVEPPAEPSLSRSPAAPEKKAAEPPSGGTGTRIRSRRLRWAAAAGAAVTGAAIVWLVARPAPAQLGVSSPPPVAATTPSPGVDPRAWDADVRGRYWMTRGSAGDVRQAVDEFESAVQLDPSFAAAWAHVAQARHMLVMIGAMRPLDAYPRAKEAADRAARLDAQLAEAHAAQGLLHLWWEWQPAPAAASFERALTINPNDAAAHHDYAWALVGLGRFDEAVRQITTARDLDPLSVRANADIGWLFLHLRQPTEATRACQQALALQPDAGEPQGCLERAFIQRGMYDDAMRAATATLPPGADIVLPTAADPVSRVQAVWRWRLRRLEEASAKRWVSPYSLAIHSAFVGDIPGAVAHIERAAGERVGALVFIRTDPALDAVRGQPRFEAVVQQVTQTSR